MIYPALKRISGRILNSNKKCKTRPVGFTD